MPVSHLLRGVLILAIAPFAFAATQGGVIPVPLPLFPANNWWNTDVSNAPVDLNSSSFITVINTDNIGNPVDRTLHPDFGGFSGDPEFPIYGIPFIVVYGAQAKLTVTFIDEDVRAECDGVNHETNESFPFYPVPDEAITMTGWVEGGQPGNVDQTEDSDRHILIVNKTNNHLYELYNVWFNGTNWEAYSGAFFDMNTNNRRPETWTSADAAGLAILPGLVRYDEVFGPDEIRHAFRFTTARTADAFVYPASHEAGSTVGAPPMGMRMRLKASKDISGFTPEMQKIFRAMKRYGLILADNGSGMYISGEFDPRWNNDVLNPAFHSLKTTDFEVVQLGWAPSVSLVLTMSSTLGDSDPADATLTAFDINNNVVTGYTGTVHFTSTDGAATLPVDYTFTPGDAGTHTFPAGFILRTPGSQVITFTDTVTPTITGSKGVTVGPPAPTSLVATAVSTAQVQISWNFSDGAVEYEIQRASSGGVFTTLTTTAGTNFNDNSVTAASAFVYQVRAIDAADRVSPFSARDAASTVTFTDDPLGAGVTAIKGTHLTELRQATNALRTVAGLTAASFTDPVLSSSVKAKAVHVQELRNALTAARSALALTAGTFTDPTLTGTTLVKAAHLQELRALVK